MSSKEKKLSEEQQSIFDKITTQKRNIFFTGPAGTGKSFLIKHIIDYYTGIFEQPDNLAITASTGRAAFNIGGITLHSFAGLGLAKEDVKTLVAKATNNKKVFHRWNQTKILIIDEISMLDAIFFDKLNRIAKSVRKSTRPFGGIQLILTGDLLQLPPVNEGPGQKVKIFDSDGWKECIQDYVMLRKVFRQADEEFAKILSCIRVGLVDSEIVDFMDKLSIEKTYDSDSGPVNLYATRAKAETFNKQNLDSIDGEIVSYKSQDFYKKGGGANSNTLDNCPALPILDLKIGAQVMLIKNINKDLVNGTVGIVTGFTTLAIHNPAIVFALHLEQLPVVRFDLANGKVFTRVVGRETWSQTLPTGEEVASRKQIPLILAWAVTIHKSQGQTIQRLRVDLSDIFESGQIYTALSRAVSPDTLEVIGFDPERVTVDEDALTFCYQNDLI